MSYGNFDVGKAGDLGLGLRVGAKYFGVCVVTNVAIDKWYKRDEGNSWRPIAASKMNEFEGPPWLRGSAVYSSLKRFGHFHYSKLRRKTDIETMKKQRRRLWMMKAYKIATANRGPAYTDRVGAVEDSEDCQETRFPRNEVPHVGRSSGSVKNRADADTVRLSNNWCPNDSSDDSSYEDDLESLCGGWRGRQFSNPTGRTGTSGSLDRKCLKAASSEEKSTRSVATDVTHNDCEDDSEMLKWRWALTDCYRDT